MWQHTECTGADINAESYLCERCDNRLINMEIPLMEQSDEGYQYYLTLLGDNRGSGVFEAHIQDNRRMSIL